MCSLQWCKQDQNQIMRPTRPGQDYKTKIKTKTGAVLNHSPASARRILQHGGRVSQASTPGSIQCLALLNEPCSRWWAAGDVIGRHSNRNNARLWRHIIMTCAVVTSCLPAAARFSEQAKALDTDWWLIDLLIYTYQMYMQTIEIWYTMEIE